MILFKTLFAIVAGSLLTLGQAAAAEITVTVKNLTNGIYFNTNRTRNRYLSLTAMLLPTNDDFVGLDSLRIPRIPGTYKYYLAGCDANSSVHIHRGIVGDTDPDGDISDLDSSIHRWLNPVAEIVIEVHPRRHGKSH